MIKHEQWDIGGEIVKADNRYVVKDNTLLDNLIVSSTKLKPHKHTTGHKHVGQEEVYIFVKGWGVMQIDDERFDVKEGDTVLIQDGVFHRVYAGNTGCYFICVFDGRRNH